MLLLLHHKVTAATSALLQSLEAAKKKGTGSPLFRWRDSRTVVMRGRCSLIAYDPRY